MQFLHIVSGVSFLICGFYFIVHFIILSIKGIILIFKYRNDDAIFLSMNMTVGIAFIWIGYKIL